MEDRLAIYRRRRERRQEYKDLAAKSCYSVIIVMIALILLRPLIIDQILSRADAYTAVGRLEESRRQCDKALLIDGESSEAWCQLARVYKVEGDRDAACAAYQSAVETDDTNGSAHFELGMMYVQDGRHQLAIPHFEQVRRLGSDRLTGSSAPEASYRRISLGMLVLCYEKVGDPVKTEMTLKEIRLFYPDYENAVSSGIAPR